MSEKRKNPKKNEVRQKNQRTKFLFRPKNKRTLNKCYNARLLASDIKSYFETNQEALEVLIFKGKKVLPVNRIQVQSPDFNRVFRRRYEK